MSLKGGTLRKNVIFLLIFFFECVNLKKGFEFKKHILNSNGIIFNPKSSISFTDSEWIILTDISFNQAEDVFSKVEKTLIENIQQKFNYENDSLLSPIADEIVMKAKYKISILEITKMRFKAFRDSLVLDSKTRTSRETPLFYFGGKLLNFLFGVATTDELHIVNAHLEKLSTETTHIVHALEQQATLVNESLWESRMNSESISKLAQTVLTIDNQISILNTKVDDLELKSIQLEKIKAEVHGAFNEIDSVLNWLEQYTDNLGFGISILFQGKLPSSLFPPTQLRKVINKIKDSLPVGWTLSKALQNGDILSVYEDARVVTASHENGITLFIHLPVYEFSLQYSLFKIINLSKAVNNGSLGLKYNNLPDYLAVSKDRQSYIELNEKEAKSCLLQSVCSIVKPIENNIKRSCAMSLYIENEDFISKNCNPVLSSWKGTESIYLGDRVWAVSSDKPLKIILTCPKEIEIVTETFTLSTLDILELPMGCSAKSEELLFQASFRKKFNSNSGGFGKNPIISHNPSYSLKSNNSTKVKIVESNASNAIEQILNIIINSNNHSKNKENRTIIRSYEQSLDKIEQEDRERLELEKKMLKKNFILHFNF